MKNICQNYNISLYPPTPFPLLPPGARRPVHEAKWSKSLFRRGRRERGRGHVQRRVCNRVQAAPEHPANPVLKAVLRPEHERPGERAEALHARRQRPPAPPHHSHQAHQGPGHRLCQGERQGRAPRPQPQVHPPLCHADGPLPLPGLPEVQAGHRAHLHRGRHEPAGRWRPEEPEKEVGHTCLEFELFVRVYVYHTCFYLSQRDIQKRVMGFWCIN